MINLDSKKKREQGADQGDGDSHDTLQISFMVISINTNAFLTLHYKTSGLPEPGLEREKGLGAGAGQPKVLIS